MKKDGYLPTRSFFLGFFFGYGPLKWLYYLSAHFDLVSKERPWPEIIIINSLFSFFRIVDDAELAEVQKNGAEQYREMIDLMSAKSGIDAKVYFHTIEIGSYSGLVSETTKFALWEVYKLTTRTQVIKDTNRTFKNKSIFCSRGLYVILWPIWNIKL